jgi:hypothetical protein
MAILPVAVLSAVMVYLGQRLVRSGLGARGAELWLGTFFLAVAAGLLVRFALALGIDLGVDAVAANVTAQLAIQAGGCAFAAFVWQTFRPAEPWARTLWIGVCAVLGLVLVLFYFTGAYASQSHPFYMVLSGSLALLFAWGFVESLLYYRLMLRRAALGLADPIVANRFLLFSAWTGACVVLPLVMTTVRAISFVNGGGAAPGGGLSLQPEAAWTLQVIRLAVVLLGPVLAVGSWLCFFPPHRYVRWIEARSTRRAVGQSGDQPLP